MAEAHLDNLHNLMDTVTSKRATNTASNKAERNKKLKEEKELIDEVIDYRLKANEKARKKEEIEDIASMKRRSRFNAKEFKKEQQDLFVAADDFKTKFGAGLKVAAISAMETVSTAINNIFTGFNKGIESYLGAYSQYFSNIETRLLGSGKSFESTSRIISNALTGNNATTQLKVLQKLNEYVDKGIAYNVEQRAFLGTIADKIATTFDAANGTLLQLIRIQQADTTAARLGLESSLNKFFNSTFKDTSYLNGLSDNISAAILGANSQLSRNGSVEFEYVVQKWLGSLSSVGVSDSTIQSIAQGLNALGTGDVNSLSNNSALQNLLVMAANNAGIDYSSLLSGGLNASTANRLLQGLVTYGQQIANTNNQVVKSQYAQIFGMTVSDLTSLLNLSTQDLVSISSNMLSYSETISETEKQLRTVGSRTTVKERIDNVLSNVMSAFGEELANNSAAYTTWVITDMVDKVTDGLLTIQTSPFGVGTKVNVLQLMKTGIVGLNAVGKIGTILSGLAGNRQLSLGDWGAEETTGRGRGLSTTLSDLNVANTTSQTAYIGNSDESAMYQGSLVAAKESNEAVMGTEDTQSNTETMTNIEKNTANIYELLSTLVDGQSIRASLDVNGLASILASLGLGA